MPMRKRVLVLTGLWLPLTCFGLAAAIPSTATADAYGVGSRIPPVSAEDQHGTPHRIDASVRIVLFSRDMPGGDVLKSALEESDPDLLDRAGAVYVADISRMPRLVTRLFALPGMRRRPLRMLLDRDGTLTRDFPDMEGKATLIHLDSLRVVRIEYIDSPELVRRSLDSGSRPEPSDPAPPSD